MAIPTTALTAPVVALVRGAAPTGRLLSLSLPSDGAVALQDTKRSLERITYGRAPIRSAKQLIGRVTSKEVEPVGPGIKTLVIARH